MKRFCSAALLCVSICLIAAKPGKAPSLPPGDIFFTIKGQPAPLERTFPGITAAFMFTDDQKAALNDAYQQTVGAPEVREQGASLKNNAATDAQRDTFRQLMDDARSELQKEVASILTPEQKALIPKIQAAADQAQKEARESFSADFATAKGDAAKANDLREKVKVEAEDLFVQKLEKFLTPAQMEAIRQAATQQKDADEQARKKKLGK